MAFTIKDIATEVGVSPTTVSLVLNNKECRVADRTRQAIVEIAAKYHYSPNLSARALVMRQSQTLGLIIPDISNPYFSELAKGVEREAQKHGYSVIFCNSGDLGRKDVDNFKLLTSRQVDAVIIVSSIQEEDINYANEFNRIAAATQVPVIQFDRQVLGGNYDLISIDHHLGGYLAAKYLISLGYKNIGCITGPLKLPSAKERFDGYLTALQEFDIMRRDELIACGDYSMQSGMRLAGDLLANGAEAIFACNDMMAFGVAKALRQHGKRAGRDFALVGFDNSPVCEYLETPLTTVDQPVYDMGKSACGLAIKNITEKGRLTQVSPVKQNIRFAPSLIIRETAFAPSEIKVID